MDSLDQQLEVREHGLGQDPVTEVETCPGRPPAWRSTSAARSRTSGAGPVSTAGSRLPWTARSKPTRRQAASSGTRQSSPTTSAPEVAIASRSVAVSVPKWMRGTPRSSRPEKIARVWGSTCSW